MKSIFKIIVLLAVLALPFGGYAQAQSYLTVSVPSKAMGREFPAAVVLPDSYESNKDARYPVLYLLHGFGGDYKGWVSIKPDMKKLASRYGIIVVCPTGLKSWYWDSPKDSSSKFETYISKELVEFVDAKYRTLASREFRAISGLSMGGHGGLWIGIRHADTFGACGSTSGGVDIMPFPDSWEMWRMLGGRWDNPELWKSHTVMNIVDKIKPGRSAIIIDCGYDDFFYRVNVKLHEALLYNNVPHDFYVRPGAHNHSYWENSIEYQMLFFSRNFERAAAAGAGK